MNTTQKDNALLPVYLVNGDDLLKRQKVMKRLKTKIAGGGDLSFNFDSFSAENATAAAIIDACNTLPFMTEVRLVQVNDVDKLKKTDADALADYLKAPAETSVLALVSDKLAQNSRLYKAVFAFGAKAVIDCLPQKRYQLVKTTRALAQEYGINITESGAQALIDLLGENTIALDSEVKKLALSFSGINTVSEQDIRDLVARTAEVKPWELVDAFSARNLSQCISFLGKMESTTPHALLAMCIARIRELICAKALSERGRAGEIAGALRVPEWRVKNHAGWAQRYSAAELRCALISARDTERAMKSGADPDNTFLEWLLACMRKS